MKVIDCEQQFTRFKSGHIYLKDEKRPNQPKQFEDVDCVLRAPETW